MRISSFEIDHTTLQKDIYLSRVDGDIITLDLRMRRPYVDSPLSIVQMHSLEHLLASALRNGNDKDKIIYCGPMGCATGFYVLVRESDFEKAKSIALEALKSIESIKKMPGNSKKECGDFRTLDLKVGQDLAREYLEFVS